MLLPWASGHWLDSLAHVAANTKEHLIHVPNATRLARDSDTELFQHAAQFD